MRTKHYTTFNFTWGDDWTEDKKKTSRKFQEDRPWLHFYLKERFEEQSMEEKENNQIISWSQGTMFFFSVYTWGDVCLETIGFLIPTEEKVNCKKTSGKQGTKISWTLLEVMTELKPFEFEELSMPDSFMRTRHDIIFNSTWGAGWTGTRIS